jgi:hypothetical protein
MAGVAMMKHFSLHIGLIAILAACSKGEALKSLDKNSLVLDPITFNLHIKNYRPQVGKSLQHLFVSNFSVTAKGGGLLYSSARDGLSDQLKISLNPTYGFFPNTPESSVAGFSDLLLYHLGLDLSQQNLVFCSGNQIASSTNDAFIYNDTRPGGSADTVLGLRDCQKIYMGLNPNKFDNAGNGIPDYLKLRCGLNPANKNEAYLSTAGDGISNLEKCKRHLPITESSNSMANRALAYVYTSQLNSDGTMDFWVNNIAVSDDGAENFLAIYITETSDTNQGPGLVTGYARVSSRLEGQTVDVDYWGTGSNPLTNREIVIP